MPPDTRNTTTGAADRFSPLSPPCTPAIVPPPRRIRGVTLLIVMMIGGLLISIADMFLYPLAMMLDDNQSLIHRWGLFSRDDSTLLHVLLETLAATALTPPSLQPIVSRCIAAPPNHAGLVRHGPCCCCCTDTSSQQPTTCVVLQFLA